VRNRVKEGPTIGSLCGAGRGRHDGHGTVAREGQRSAGSAKEEGWKGKGSVRPGGSTRPAGPDQSAGSDGRWAGGKKKENRNLF
jgi:hypothetical protein